MYRVTLALMLGTACLLVAYGQFNGLPGHVDDSRSLAAVMQEALAACIFERGGRTMSVFARLYEPKSARFLMPRPLFFWLLPGLPSS
jgi:hypothetical protein